MSVRSMSKFDQISRRVLLAIGSLAFVVGVLTIVVVDPLVGILPSTYLLVFLSGTSILLLGLWMVRARMRAGVTQAVVPNVEKVLSTPAPGNNVDRALYRLTNYRQGTVEYREQLQERLASVAIAVISYRDDCSREQAIQQLNEGTWTDNNFAASFFTDGSPPKVSLGERIRNRFVGDGESSYEKWVKQTVDAIIERSEIDVESDQLDDDDDDDSGFLDDLLGSDSDVTDDVLSVSSYKASTAESTRVDEENGIAYRNLLETGHWGGVSAFGLVAAGWGAAMYQPQVFLLGVVGVAFAAYARTASEPPVSDLEVTRKIDNETPQPGDLVEVTVTVENTGDSFLPDLRMVDRVPGPMQVVEGTPRIATSLQSGASATFSYTALAERGEHEWPLVVYARDFSGSIEREAAIEVDRGHSGIECLPSLKTTRNAPVRSQTSLYSGQVDTPTGGSGLEFFQVREYRKGDPMKRIDWKRHARDGELATIDFREEKAAKVMLMFDSRESAYVSPGPNQRHAVDRSVDAGMELFAALFDKGNLVGVSAFDTVPCFLGSGASDKHRERARQLFAGHPAISSLPPELKDAGGQYVDPMTHIRRRLAPESQIMLFSPLCDDYSAEVARRLDSVGHRVTVISPDPTASRTIGERLAKVERAIRVKALREHGIRVVDWERGERLGVQIGRAQTRWAQ